MRFRQETLDDGRFCLFLENSGDDGLLACVCLSPANAGDPKWLVRELNAMLSALEARRSGKPHKSALVRPKEGGPDGTIMSINADDKSAIRVQIDTRPGEWIPWSSLEYAIK